MNVRSPRHAGEETVHGVYRECLGAMQCSGVPFLVGGAFGLESYTGLRRRTKDLDVFVRPHDVEALLEKLSQAGYRTEIRFSHWLGKAFMNDHFIDIIFGSGNGVCPVDDLWFTHAESATILGQSVRIVPAEEMIWSKAFIMERERYDGGDIAHLLRARGNTLDWPRLLCRFHGHWRVLFSHLVLFGFVYPAHRLTVPKWLMDELMRRLQDEMASLPADDRLCQGTLLSWSQYLMHTERGEYLDARHPPCGTLSEEDTARVTAVMKREQSK
jgi:Uncharacterised nucleotidyltransferase